MILRYALLWSHVMSLSHHFCIVGSEFESKFVGHVEGFHKPIWWQLAPALQVLNSLI